MADTSLIARIILRLQDEASQGLDNARQRIGGVGEAVNKVKQLLIGWLSFEAVKAGVGTIIDLSDTFARLSGRVKQAVGAGADYIAKQKELYDISQRAYVALEDTTALYARSAQALKNLANGQALAAKLTETVNLSFRAQSSSAAKVSSTVTQLTQAIATDAVQWEDFGQLADTNLMLVNVAAKNLGYDGIGSLKQAMADGQVSNIELVNAIVEGFDEIKDAADQMPVGVEAAIVALKNKLLQLVGGSDRVSEAVRGSRDSVVSAVKFVTEHLDGLIELAVKAGEVLLVAFGVNTLKGVVRYTEGLFTASAAARDAALAATALATTIATSAAAAGTAAATAATAAGATIADIAAAAGLAAGDAAVAAGATITAAAEAAGLAASTAARAAGASAVQAANAGATAAEAAAVRARAAGVVAAEGVGIFSKALKAIPYIGWLVVAGEIGAAIGEWATQFRAVKIVAAELGKAIAVTVAFVETLMHPSLENWSKFGDEVGRIKARFDEVYTRVDKIDKAAAPTVFDRLKASANSMAEGIDAALTTAKDAAKTHADAMVKPYDDAAKAITAAFDAQSARIDQALKDRLYAIDYTAANEKQKIADTTQAVIAAEFEKTTAALNTKIQLDQTWNETYGTAIELARKAGGDISELEQQGAQARIGSLQSVVNAYQSSVDNMIGEEHRLLDAIRHTDEERKNLSRSVEDKVRALQQKGMSDVQAYADQHKQIDEKQAAAKKAILEGNFSDAKKYAEEAIRLAESTAHAVDNVSKDSQGKTQRKEAISENQASAKSIEQIKESAALADSALAGLGNAQLAQAQNVAKSLEGAKSGLAEFKGELDRTIADVNNKAQVKLSIDATAARVEMDKLAALTAAKELTVKIKADPLNADAEIAALQAKLAAAKITVPAVIAFDKMRDAELEKIQEELRKSIAFLTAVPVGVDTTEAVASLEQMKASIDEKLSSPTTANHTVNPDFEAVFRNINEIKQNTFSTHTVYINEVRQHATGGLIQKFATGGRVAAQTFKRVLGAVKGPGTGTSDAVPVMASNGEFVVKTDAVQYYGVNFMNALNNKQLPVAPGYALGGAIGDAGSGTAAPPSTAQRETINLNFNFGPKTVTLQGSRSAARELAVELRSLARLS